MRVISGILISLLLLLQTGCWNAREINELGFVLSIALDKAPDGFKVTTQIAKPDTHGKSPTSGVAGVVNEKPFWVISSSGKTIFEAIRNMASISSRRIFWSHIKVIIISEELARNNVLEIFDFFSRNPELRLRTLIAVAPGEAGKLLEVVPITEKDPALYLEKVIEGRNLTGKAYGIMLKDFLEDFLEPGSNPVASRIIISESESQTTLKVQGACVFNHKRMISWLNEKQTRGLLWMKNQIKDTIIVVNCPYDDLPVTLEIKKAKTKFKSYMEDGIPHFTIDVTADANLTERACTTDFTDPKALKDLEKVMASAIQEDIQTTVEYAQGLNTDFLGLNTVLHTQHKDEWHRVSKNWGETFSNAKINIAVKANIPQVSLQAKPLTPIKDSE